MARRTKTNTGSVSKEKIVIAKKHAYRIEVTAEDYIFFASAEKGKVAETYPLLHNYALTYAMGWVHAPYHFAQQAPTYMQDFQALNEQGVYIFPARAMRCSQRMMQYNTTDEAYVLTREQSMGIPNWGYVKVICPGSVFVTYVISRDKLNFPAYIRLGKWLASCRLTVRELELSSAENAASSHLLNVRDMQQLPNFFLSLYNMLPSRLVQEAEWEHGIAGYKLMDAESKESLFVPESAYWIQ
jgi:CRISPR-associated protein Csc1